MGVYLRGKSYYIDFYDEGKRYTGIVGMEEGSADPVRIDRQPGRW